MTTFPNDRLHDAIACGENNLHPTFDKIFRTTFPAVYEKPEKTQCKLCGMWFDDAEDMHPDTRLCQECQLQIGSVYK